ncbi:MAG: hypothetical protein J1E39_04490 [Eubacterium sp.]|nr:hypothetical protein [Eubacterium sp.]
MEELLEVMKEIRDMLADIKESIENIESYTDSASDDTSDLVEVVYRNNEKLMEISAAISTDIPQTLDSIDSKLDAIDSGVYDIGGKI